MIMRIQYADHENYLLVYMICRFLSPQMTLGLLSSDNKNNCLFQMQLIFLKYV